MTLQEQFINWYAKEYAWLRATVDPSCILRIEGDHLLVKQYGYRFTLFRQIGKGFTRVFDGGSDQPKTEAEFLRRSDPAVYWSIPEKIQHFSHKGLGQFIQRQYQKMLEEARPWNLHSATIRSKLMALETLTVTEMETAAMEYRQQCLQTA